MKLAIINAESGKGGGPATIADDIYKNFVADGNEAVVCFGRQCADDDVNRYRIGGKLDLLWHGFISRVFDAHGMASKSATQKLVEFLKEYQPDVVNLHNIHGYYLNYSILFKYLKEADIPVVWTLHDCWPFTGHCAYFDLVGCDKWKTGCHHCPQIKSYPASFGLDTSKSTYNRKKKIFSSIGKNLTLVPPSAWLGDLAKESFLKDCRIEVINNGIDLNVFKPNRIDMASEESFRKKHGLTDKVMVLALASEWTPRKGFDDMIYIGTHLPENYKLVMVGLSPEQLSQIPPEIIPITRTNNVEELIQIYSEADVFANASVEDNFPTVILESLACGTPVVTYDTGGCREEINEKCGILVDKYDKAAIISGLIQMGKKTDSVSEACLEKATTFEKKKMYDRYNQLFHDLVKSSVK